MDKNLKNIEDLFKKGLTENEEIPSSDVWNNIDKSLDKENIVTIKRKYKNLQQIVSVLVVLLVIVGVYEFAGLKENKISTTSDKKSLNQTVQENDDRNIGFSKNSPNGSTENAEVKNAGKVVGKGNLQSDKNANAKVIFENRSKESVGKENQKGFNTPSRILSRGKTDRSSSSHKEAQPTSGSSLVAHFNQSQSGNKSFENSLITPNALIENGGNREITQNSIPVKSDKETNMAFPKPENLEEPSITRTDLSSAEKNDEIKGLMDPITPEINKKFNSKNKRIHLLKQSRFSLTGFYTQNISYYHFKNEESNGNSIDFEKKEDYNSSSSAGFLVEYSLNNHWGIQSGISLSTTHIALAPETIYAQLDDFGDIGYEIITSSGSAYVLPSFIHNPRVGDSIYSVSTAHTLKYLMIPLALKYNLAKGKFNINARAGVVANLLTKATIETEIETGSHHETETAQEFQGLKSFYISGITGVGIDYNLKKNLAVCFFPTYRFALNSINKDVPVKSFPNSLSFGLGLKIKL